MFIKGWYKSHTSKVRVANASSFGPGFDMDLETTDLLAMVRLLDEDTGESLKLFMEPEEARELADMLEKAADRTENTKEE